jgi:DNA-binding response OmpR family regulator
MVRLFDGEAAAEGKEGAMAHGRGLILLVEDDDDLREMEVGILEWAGFRVVSAREGREALELVAREMPRVIFLDMRMPGMDGWAFAREFRVRHDHLAAIIVVTAAASAEARALEIAAEGSLSKPFEIDELIAAARAHVPSEAEAPHLEGG